MGRSHEIYYTSCICNIEMFSYDLVRELGETQLEASHTGGVQTEGGSQALHVPYTHWHSRDVHGVTHGRRREGDFQTGERRDTLISYIRRKIRCSVLVHSRESCSKSNKWSLLTRAVYL